ncbi:MAG: excinuclease ABC subunit UvrC [Desulfatirhabdiaceae bacterium]|nr:excinuclease ABC subunit UvrC [Desulfatirhabdiaceae bacterium]
MKDNILESQYHEQLKLLAGISADPGVYLMKDASGKVIYVGKARNLKKRLNSYFNRAEHPDPKTAVLVKRIASIETIITATENEALILESTLIKKHRPRYNVILKDDKRYPSLRMDTKSPYPNLTVVRKISRDGAVYFGPYTSPTAVYQTLKIINKTFKLRKCRDRMFKTRTRPCLNYQIGSCMGPCCLKVDPERYQEMVREVFLFLKGRTPDLVAKLKQDMNAAALERQYELAAEIRDKLFSIEKTLEKQIVVMADFLDRDVLGFTRSPADSIVTVLFVRAGHLVGSRNFHFTETLASDAELIGSFIQQFYEQATHIPDEILVSIVFDGMDVIQEWLTDLKKLKVDVIWPQRGPKLHLIHMAEQNAGNELKNLIEDRLSDQTLLLRLQKQLNLARLPVRIECFDNSNISGTQPVSGMVVFEHTRPKKSDYRKYRIKTVSEPDDYATMAEVLKRRYGRGEDAAPLPDLLMVDGGKGQLGIAVSVLDELNLTGRFDVLGIAKKDDMKGETQDKIYKPGRLNPMNLDRDGNLLLFLQRIRDEAHRFVITYHRSRRGAAAIRSVLDSIPGVGPKRKQALLKHYGSIKAIRAASIDELSQAPGMNRKIAEMVQGRLSIPLTEDE